MSTLAQRILTSGLLCIIMLNQASGELLVATNSQWKFKKGTEEASAPDIAAWRLLAFDDASWLDRQAPFYYSANGTYQGHTLITDMRSNYLSIFIRRPFVLNKKEEVTGLTLTAVCDDGFVAWINGTEVKRINMLAGNVFFNSHASNAINASGYVSYPLPNPQDYLVDGTNLLAVQGFNANLTSSDLLVDLELSSTAPDVAPPQIVRFQPAPGELANLTQITVVFSEPVATLFAEDLLINGQAATSVSGSGDTYSFSFPAPVFGNIDVTWDAAQDIKDLAGNRFDGTASDAQCQYLLVDKTPPLMVSVNPPAGATVRSLSQVTVNFSEPVIGVDAGDMLINGQPAAQITGTGAGPYVFQFTEPATGTVHVTWISTHGIRDTATPANDLTAENWDLFLDPQALAAPVIINEFLAANTSTAGLKDEDGEPQPWLELYNTTDKAINLQGYAVTDNADAPDRWTFPGIPLGPKQYLVVFLSGKDRKPTTGGRLHTNFKINPSGNYLGLYNNESPRRAVSEFRPEFPPQRSNYSYGRDDRDLWRYFKWVTPGTVNGSSDIEGMSAKVHFSVSHGFFNRPFSLSLTTETPGATIRYTVDGSEPTEQNGLDYASAITLDRTTVLRAAAFRPRMLPSAVETRTYLFLEDVIRQPEQPAGLPMTWYVSYPATGYPANYGMDPKVTTSAEYAGTIISDLRAIPSLSIVCNSEDMFGATNGIYSHASASASGPAWVRSCSVELIDPAGKESLQIDCGIKLHGGGSREQYKSRKHSFRLVFKGDYGPSKLNYRFFPDSPVSEFDVIDLRGDYNNHWTHQDSSQQSRGTLVRDAWYKDLAANMGSVSSHSRYVHLYINGMYWGVYNPCERPDASFAAAYFGGAKEQYDAFNGTAPSPPADGDAVARNTLLSIGNLADPAQYELIKQYLDVTQYIDYFITQVYGANKDWGPTKNWYSFRKRAPGEGFKYMCWDDERTLEGINDFPVGVSGPATLNSVSPDNLQAKLAANAEYRLAFADRIRKHFYNGGALTPEAVIASWKKRSAQIDRAIVGESARWGDLWVAAPYTRNQHWLNEQNRLINTYFPNRSAIVMDQFRAAGLYPAVEAPQFNQHGGVISQGFGLTISASAGTIYYTTNEVDPRVAGSGAVSPEAITFDPVNPVQLTRNTRVKTRALLNGQWSALTEADYVLPALGSPLRITEIMYQPPLGSAYEFIELMNTRTDAIDLSGGYFEGVEYIFPTGTRIAGNEVLVLASDLNPTAFAAQYPGVKVAGYFQHSLANGGETIRLRDKNKKILASVDFLKGAGWPQAASGGGSSLVVVDPNGDPNDPANWRASAEPGGTPGKYSVMQNQPGLQFNEVFAAARTNGSDFIELYNSGSLEIDLTGWSVTDNENPRRYLMPSQTILAPATYLVLWCDEAANQPGLHTGFGLDRDGERLVLYDAATNRVDVVTLGQQVENYSCARAALSREWQMSVPTPGAENAAAELAASGSLAINEWVANPIAGGDDWIELYNRNTNKPAALKGVFLAAGNALFEMQSLSCVPPNGFIRLWADNRAGGNHLDFDLSAAGGFVALYDSAANQIDRVACGPQSEGESQGRLPDGAANIVAFPQSASPGAANYQPAYNGPVLNEILARNIGVTTNLSGRAADFIELYNPLDQAFDLSGMSLSFNENSAGQWFFPSGSQIAADGYLILWCDASQPPSTNTGAEMQFGRRLDGNGGTVRLFDVSGRQVDEVQFGCQVADLSLGRSQGSWGLLAAPTPGAMNTVICQLGNNTALRFNEWLAWSSDGDDWFELYNPSDLPVEVSGMHLANDPSMLGVSQFVVKPLSYVGPHACARWLADEEPGTGPDHTDFRLDRLGGTLRLYANSLALIDSVYYGAQSMAASEGRLPDGGLTFARFTRWPTPGRVNQIPATDVVINEVMYHPLEKSDGQEAFEDEYIEIFNYSARPILLYDAVNPVNRWRINGGAHFAFPPDLSLPPGGYLLVVGFNPDTQPDVLSEFRRKYLVPAAVPVIGPFAGHLANQGESLELLRPAQPVAVAPNLPYIPYDMADRMDCGPSVLNWSSADGCGAALLRHDPSGPGGEMTNWRVDLPSPGRSNDANVPAPIIVFKAWQNQRDAVLRLEGLHGSAWAVEFSTDLSAWAPLSIQTLAGGSAEFADRGATNSPCRFYRAALVKQVYGVP